MKHKKEIAHMNGLLKETEVPDARKRWKFETVTRQIIELVEANKLPNNTDLKLEMNEDMGGEEWGLTATATAMLGDVTMVLRSQRSLDFHTNVENLVKAGRELQISVQEEMWHAVQARKERTKQ